MGRRKLTEQEKIEKQKRAEEERIQSNLNRELQELRESYINEPTIRWEVGERVTFGLVNEVTIVDILDNGKIIKIHCINIVSKESRDAGKITEIDHYVAWHDIMKYRTAEENKTIEPFSQKEDVFINSSNRVLSDIVGSMYYRFGIEMDPDYQREHVWDLADKVNLIESMFNNIDIGKFVFVHNGYGSDKLYEIVDGKQRLTAFIEFMERRFAYKGKYWDDLSFRDQDRLENYSVGIGELRSLDGKPLTKTQKYQSFLKLNTTGKAQDPKHIKYVEALLSKEQKC